jgi:hypothetical protein
MSKTTSQFCSPPKPSKGGAKEDGDVDLRLNSFLCEISELCRKYGLGITGTPALFLMEPVDYQLDYKVDGDSNLVLR